MNQPKWAKKFKENLMILSMPEINALTGYTGKGSDGKLQVSNPVWEDKMQVHEGEYVVKSADVEKHGGPKGVEKKLGIKPAPNVIPFCKGGMVRKFLTGGPVVGSSYYNSDWYQKQNDPSKMTVNLLNGQVQNATQQKLLEGGATPNTVTTTGIASTAPFATAPVPAPVVPSLTTTEHYGSQWTAEDQARADAAQSTTTWTAPEPVAPAPTERYKTIAGGSVIDTTTGKIVQMGAQDLSTNLNLNKPAPAPVTNADRVDQYGNQVDDTIAIYNEIKSGNSPMVKKLVDSAYGNLDPRLATQAMVLAMQIAQNPNMTEGAKRASIAEQMRDAGLAQAGLAGTLATQALNMAMEAIGMSATLSQNQQAFYETKRKYENGEGWNALKGMVDGGATYDQVKARYPDITEAQFASIRDAGTLGARDWDRKLGIINTLITTGGESNLTNAANMLNNIFPGTNIDFSKIIQSDKVSQFNDGMAQLQALINAKADYDTVIKPTMDRLGLTAIVGGDDAMRSLYTSAQTAASPIMQMLDTYDDVFVEKFPAPAGTDAETWKQTIKNTITKNVSYNQETGVWTPDYDGIMASLQMQTRGPVRPKNQGGTIDVTQTYTGTDLATYSGTAEPAASTKEWTIDGKTWYRGEDNNWSTTNPAVSGPVDIPATDISVNNNNVSFGLTSAGSPGYWNGGGFTAINEGQTFEITSQTKTSQSSTPLPKGTYQLKKVPIGLTQTDGTFKQYGEVLVYVKLDGNDAGTKYLADAVPVSGFINRSGTTSTMPITSPNNTRSKIMIDSEIW